VIYNARIIQISDVVEGEIDITVCGFNLNCFCNNPPELPKENSSCEVELIPMVFGKYIVKKAPPGAIPQVIKEGNSFAYSIFGVLQKSQIIVDHLIFEDDYLIAEFGYLEGELVEWHVDRIDVDFLG
jgi:hypothetical protein